MSSTDEFLVVVVMIDKTRVECVSRRVVSSNRAVFFRHLTSSMVEVHCVTDKHSLLVASDRGQPRTSL